MPQARGWKGQFTYVKETTFGTTPGSPAMQLFSGSYPGETLGAVIEKLGSDAFTGIRARVDLRGGNVDVAGAVPFEVSAEGKLDQLLTGFIGPAAAPVAVGDGTFDHVIKLGTLASFTFNKRFTDLGTAISFTGSKVNRWGFQLTPQGLIRGNMAVFAQDFAEVDSGADSSPGIHIPFVHHEAVIVKNAQALTIFDFSLSGENGLDNTNTRPVGSRYVDELPEGDLILTGSFVGKFDSVAAGSLYDDWKNTNEISALVITLTSAQTPARKLIFNIPKLKLFGDGIPKLSTKSGIFIPFEFEAKYSTSDVTNIIVTVRNTRSTQL